MITASIALLLGGLAAIIDVMLGYTNSWGPVIFTLLAILVSLAALRPDLLHDIEEKLN